MQRSWRRLFSEGGPANAETFRRTFLKIKPDKQLLDHLDHLGLGYVAKRRSRKAIASKFEKLLPGVRPAHRKKQDILSSKKSKMPSPSPYPFNKGARKVQKILTAKTWDEVPDFGEVPEFAIIGRSNVGKSTLLNAILGYSASYVQKASVSDKPGETTALQFFTLGRHITTKQPTLVVTDMPGYGFAFMSRAEAKRCFYLSSEYLRSRGNRRLKRVLLLIDARHGFKQTDFRCLHDLVTMNYHDPAVENEINDIDDNKEYDKQENDFKMGVDIGSIKMPWKLQVILTKCDLVERVDLARRVQLMKDEISEKFSFLKTANMPILMVSAQENKGIVELHKDLASLVPPTASGRNIGDV